MASTARLGLKRHDATLLPGRSHGVGMASTARLGLKREKRNAAQSPHSRRNGLYSPFGIETTMVAGVEENEKERRNGLYSPFGIETTREAICTANKMLSEWPLQPVWD